MSAISIEGFVRLKVNVSLLRQQKAALLRAIDNASPKDAKRLDGVLNVLDHIHDALDPPKQPRR